MTTSLDLGIDPGQRSRRLRDMRMLRPGVNLQFLDHGASQLVLGQHPLHGQPDDFLRLVGLHVAEAGQLVTARIKRVPEIDLLVALSPRHAHLLRIDHDHVIPDVEVRGVRGLALPLEHARDLARQPAQDLPVGVGDKPVLHDLRGAHGIRAHWIQPPHGKYGANVKDYRYLGSVSTAASRKCGARWIPRSVMMAVTRPAGVTSKAGFRAGTPGGAIGIPWNARTSDGSRSSMGMAAPEGHSGSYVEGGATTTNGIPRSRAARASGYVPILLATSPLPAIRSAPTTTAWIEAPASSEAAAPSATTVTGIPSRCSSHAVSRAPCRSGRVSVAQTETSRPLR